VAAPFACQGLSRSAPDRAGEDGGSTLGWAAPLRWRFSRRQVPCSSMAGSLRYGCWGATKERSIRHRLAAERPATGIRGCARAGPTRFRAGSGLTHAGAP